VQPSAGEPAAAAVQPTTAATEPTAVAATAAAAAAATTTTTMKATLLMCLPISHACMPLRSGTQCMHLCKKLCLQCVITDQCSVLISLYLIDFSDCLLISRLRHLAVTLLKQLIHLCVKI
jgi:hypothetical protein